MEHQADVPTRQAEGAALRMKLAGLRRWNTAMGALHVAQGAAMLALASASMARPCARWRAPMAPFQRRRRVSFARSAAPLAGLLAASA